jgi:hypothetical protein
MVNDAERQGWHWTLTIFAAKHGTKRNENKPQKFFVLAKKNMASSGYQLPISLFQN